MINTEADLAIGKFRSRNFDEAEACAKCWLPERTPREVPSWNPRIYTPRYLAVG
jgi:hypothetical protein